MEQLQEAVHKLAVEFDRLLLTARENIDEVADASRSESQSRLDTDRERGVLAEAEKTRDRIEASIAKYKQFQQQLDQLEQVYLISEDLKNVVRRLEKS